MVYPSYTFDNNTDYDQVYVTVRQMYADINSQAKNCCHSKATEKILCQVDCFLQAASIDGDVDSELYNEERWKEDVKNAYELLKGFFRLSVNEVSPTPPSDPYVFNFDPEDTYFPLTLVSIDGGDEVPLQETQEYTESIRLSLVDGYPTFLGVVHLSDGVNDEYGAPEYMLVDSSSTLFGTSELCSLVANDPLSYPSFTNPAVVGYTDLTGGTFPQNTVLKIIGSLANEAINVNSPQSSGSTAPYYADKMLVGFRSNYAFKCSFKLNGVQYTDVLSRHYINTATHQASIYVPFGWSEYVVTDFIISNP